jgi:hypothetical protein
MNDVECVWWCRTPGNSAEYGSGERRIALLTLVCFVPPESNPVLENDFNHTDFGQSSDHRNTVQNT